MYLLYHDIIIKTRGQSFFLCDSWPGNHSEPKQLNKKRITCTIGLHLGGCTIQWKGDPRHGLYPNWRKWATGFRTINGIAPHSKLSVRVSKHRDSRWESSIWKNSILLSGETWFAGEWAQMRVREANACQQSSGHHSSPSLLRRWPELLTFSSCSAPVQ